MSDDTGFGVSYGEPKPAPVAQAQPSQKVVRHVVSRVSAHDARPVIQVTAGNLHTVTDAAEQAVIAAGLAVFHRAGQLVRPTVREVTATHGRKTLAAGLTALDVPAAVDLLSGAVRFVRFDARSNGLVQIDPPERLAKIWLARRGRWTVPPVSGVITTPTLRPDGSILSAPGYDPVTQLFHEHDASVILTPAVANPTRRDALQAVELLRDLLAGFPFDGPVALAVGLSAVITPVVRGAMQVVPLHIIRARTPGTGKSYLVDVAAAVATGRPCPVASAAPNDDAETEKRLTGLLLSAFSLICLDNLNGELGGDLICQAVERPYVLLRPLGRSDIVEIESRAILLGTGNNLRVRGDLTRRTIYSDMDAGIERPEMRQFNSDPVAMVLGNRGLYVSAAIVICRAYILAGRPGMLPVLASFSDWSNLVRSALVWLGTADPVGSMEQGREDDPELETMREVMAAWDDANGSTATTCKHVIAQAGERGARPDENGDVSPYAPQTELRFPNLHDALARVAAGRSGLDPKKLGTWLRSHEGRVVDGLKFQRDGMVDGVVRWKLFRR